MKNGIDGKSDICEGNVKKWLERRNWSDSEKEIVDRGERRTKKRVSRQEYNGR